MQTQPLQLAPIFEKDISPHKSHKGVVPQHLNICCWHHCRTLNCQNICPHRHRHDDHEQQDGEGLLLGHSGQGPSHELRRPRQGTTSGRPGTKYSPWWSEP